MQPCSMASLAFTHFIVTRYGYKGFYDRRAKPIVLNRKVVEDIQLAGGTMLGTSRGGADLKEIVKRIDMWGIDMLFVVGGNGGNAGANAIQKMCERDGVNCSVVGIPKSIDNDILLVGACNRLQVRRKPETVSMR